MDSLYRELGRALTKIDGMRPVHAALVGAHAGWRLDTAQCDCDSGRGHCDHGAFPWRIVDEAGRELMSSFKAAATIREAQLMALAPALKARNGRLVEFLRWLVSLTSDDPDGRMVSLVDITGRAELLLGDLTCESCQHKIAPGNLYVTPGGSLMCIPCATDGEGGG